MKTTFISTMAGRQRCAKTLIATFGISLGLAACSTQPPAPVEESSASSTSRAAVSAATELPVNAVNAVNAEPLSAEAAANARLQAMLDEWNDPAIQARPAFKIFDNLYYVGIDWVAAYVLKTSDGLILIDSLYGKWVDHMIDGIINLGLDPNDIRYVLVTHGHFDHAGGATEIQERYGATVVMTEEDWALARQPADRPEFTFRAPAQGVVAADGDFIELGDTRVDFFKTPGHTEGVLSLRYPVHDGRATYTALTLGGVGLNFSGVARTETYLKSYARIRRSISQGVSVSLPNHAQMGRVFERAERLAERRPGTLHPFVDPAGLQGDLKEFVLKAEAKLEAEHAGTAGDPMDALTDALADDND